MYTTIENLLGRLMAQKGAAAALERAQAMHPILAADQHKIALLRRDKTLALALEYHVRSLAISHFHKGDVLRAVSTVEKNLKQGLGRYGTGATKPLQAIADEIERQALAGDYARDIDNALAIFKVGPTTIRCRDTPGSIAVVVAKYRRGMARGGRSKL